MYSAKCEIGAGGLLTDKVHGDAWLVVYLPVLESNLFHSYVHRLDASLLLTEGLVKCRRQGPEKLLKEQALDVPL
jgi:hypothetical protein